MYWIIQEIKIVPEEPDDKPKLTEIKSYQDLDSDEPEWEFPAWSANFIATTKKLVLFANNKVYYQN